MIVSFKREESYSFDNSVFIQQSKNAGAEYVEVIEITHRTVLKALIAALQSCLEAQQHRSVNNLMYHIDNSPDNKGERPVFDRTTHS